MRVISDIDKKIIYELGKNARITYQKLAKISNSKKTVIAYHIEQLQQKEIIWKFVPVISLSRLGIYTYKIYFKFQGLDKQQKKAMLDALQIDPHIAWTAEATGTWDLLIALYCQNLIEFANKKKELFHKYGDYIEEYAITLIEDGLVFNRDYLIKNKIDYRKEFIYGGTPKLELIDEDQKNIIRLIKNEGRYQITKIAEKLKLNVKTIMTKIKDLEDRKIIQGYTTFLHINNISLKFFKLCLYFQDYREEKFNEVLQFCKMQKNVLHLVKSIGAWELELEIEAENVEYIYDLIEEIKTKYPKIIKKIDVIIITNERKLEFFPEWY